MWWLRLPCVDSIPCWLPHNRPNRLACLRLTRCATLFGITASPNRWPACGPVIGDAFLRWPDPVVRRRTYRSCIVEPHGSPLRWPVSLAHCRYRWPACGPVVAILRWYVLVDLPPQPYRCTCVMTAVLFRRVPEPCLSHYQPLIVVLTGDPR
jgi:hypothetical protein